MRLGLVSDTHDNETRTHAVVALFAREDVDAVLHAGDLSSPGSVRFFDGWATWIARGNTDAATPEILAAARLCRSEIRYGEVHELSLDGVRIGLIHGDDGARRGVTRPSKAGTGRACAFRCRTCRRTARSCGAPPPG